MPSDTFTIGRLLEFAICYVVVIALGIHLTSTPISEVDGLDADGVCGSVLIAIGTNVLYIFLLLSQLVVFLKCQLDPVFHDHVAYRRYKFQPLPLLATGSADVCVVNEVDYLLLLERKIDGMTRWAHGCLFVPPNPYANSLDQKGGKGKRRNQTQCRRQSVQNSLELFPMRIK